MCKYLFSCCCLFVFALYGLTQIPVDQQIELSYFLPQGDFSYRSDIPTPKQFFGEVDAILKNSVILIHPATNPDGLERFATWINTNRSFTPVPDPNSREFREPQPGGRSNHYWFDLNRDWLMLQMPESQARLKFYYRWRPTMVNDYHEQGISNNYYFSPGAIKQTHNLIPATNWEVTRQISLYHAEALNKIGAAAIALKETYGITASTVATFRESVSFFKSPTPYSCPVSYLEEPLLSGCVAPDLLKQIASTPAALCFPRLVYFADPPVYRAYWFGTTRLFLNAIFFPI